MVETFLVWADNHQVGITAIATVVLSVIAGIQITLEILRRHDSRVTAERLVLGPAWLARRTCEQALFAARETDYPIQWAHRIGKSAVLDRIEQQMLEVLRTSSAGYGDLKGRGHEAFRQFLIYADSVNQLTSFEFSGRSPAGGMEPTPADFARMKAEFARAVAALRDTIGALEALAPRQSHEAKLPTLDQFAKLRWERDDAPRANIQAEPTAS